MVLLTASDVHIDIIISTSIENQSKHINDNSEESVDNFMALICGWQITFVTLYSFYYRSHFM